MSTALSDDAMQSGRLSFYVFKGGHADSECIGKRQEGKLSPRTSSAKQCANEGEVVDPSSSRVRALRPGNGPAEEHLPHVCTAQQASR